LRNTGAKSLIPAPGKRYYLLDEGTFSARPRFDLDRARFNIRHVRRAPKWSWPIGRDGRRLWPSYPTASEVLLGGADIIRRRELILADETIKRPRRELNMSDPSLINNILGVRADERVPIEYLAFFEYRWDMLILTRRENLPRPFRKFLIGLWNRRRHSLWLRRAVPLVTYLRNSEIWPEVFFRHPPAKS
jgi:hypothetical protein